MDSAKLSICEKTSIALLLISLPKDLVKSIFLSVTVIMKSMKSALRLLFGRGKKTRKNNF